MRRITSTIPLGLALLVLAGCDSPTSVSGGSDAILSGPGAAASLVPQGIRLERPRLDVTQWQDVTNTVPVALVTPEAAGRIGPGSAILITIPDEGRFGCTANFVWRSHGKRYLGAAGHCFLPADRAATHGPGADYNAAGVVVEVCVEGCEGNFRTNQVTGTWATLGQVAYARQTFAGEDVGNDFGVVEVPGAFRDFIRTSMPVWGGPTGVQTLELGDYACHYGHGLGFGEVFPTKARIGIGGGSDDDAWMGDFAGSPGDSGSSLIGCVNDGVGSFHGTGAIGVLTHLGFGIDESTGAHGTIFGTTIARAIEMGKEARLKLSLVLP